MRNLRFMMVFLALFGIFFLGFPSLFLADEPGTDTESSTQVKKEVKEALQAIKGYSVEKRDDAVKKTRMVMQDLDVRIQDLEDKIQDHWARMDEAARRNARATLQALREKRSELAEWSGGVKYSSAKAWDHVKQGFLDSYTSLRDAFDKAEDEFHADEAGRVSNK